MPSPSPRTAVARHRSGAMDARALMRALVEHDEWRVPAIPETMSPRWEPRDHGVWLSACSDDEAWATYAVSSCFDGPFLQMPGHTVFDAVLDGAEGVDVDPHSEHAIHYRREQLGPLAELAAAVEIERILSGVGDDPEAFRKLILYPGYRIVSRAGPEGKAQLVLAPDSQQRLLAPVFTASDTLEAFLARHLEGSGLVPVVSTLDGKALFQMLSKLWLHGIVFNCSGPVSPKAVSARFAMAVLERDDGK